MSVYTVTAPEVATFISHGEKVDPVPQPRLLDSASVLSGEPLKKPLQLVTQLSSSLCHRWWS